MNKKICVFLAFAIINILALIAFGDSKYDRSARIIFLDMGQGDATLILAENDNQVLIDGGDGKKIMNKLGQYMPFYDRKIELLIITHPDSDHIGGLIDVIKYYDINEIMMTKYSCDTDICKELDKVITEKAIMKKYAKSGQTIYAGSQTLKILNPLDDKINANDNNDNSIVIKTIINGKILLLSGDAGFKIENELSTLNINIDSDILKISHHGSKNATSGTFIEKVSPEKAIISVGKNRYGHPSKDVLNRLKNANISILRTDEAGDIIIE